jgi:hypothetical protein
VLWKGEHPSRFHWGRNIDIAPLAGGAEAAMHAIHSEAALTLYKLPRAAMESVFSCLLRQHARIVKFVE